MLDKTPIRPAGCSHENLPAFRLNRAFLTHAKQESQVARKATARDSKRSLLRRDCYPLAVGDRATGTCLGSVSERNVFADFLSVKQSSVAQW
jgi:hypothetical protein